MESPFSSPLLTQQSYARPPLPRNYSETFNAADYEKKDSIELESYARNLHNYLQTLLPQNPFPANLFDKLEKRLDGITSILQSRSLASGVLSRDAAKKKLERLGNRLESTAPVLPTLLTPQGMNDDKKHPAKKRKLDAP